MGEMTVDILLKLHQVAILMYGGAEGVLDEGTLHYLTEKISHCSDPVLMAVYLLHGIATMHPFFDGNKRTALMAADAVLGLHGMMITASNEMTASFVLSVARGEKTEEHVEKWIRKNSDR
jgi:death on curing protein